MSRSGRRGRYNSYVPNFRIEFTGDGLIELQRQITEDRPTTGITALPSDPDVIREMFGCVGCRMIPDPNNYLVCEENGHFVCSSCVSKRDGGFSYGSKSKLQELDSCCFNLRKGHHRILEQLLEYSTYECVNRRYGCKELVLGCKWKDHVQKCGFMCKHFNCSVMCGTMEEMLEHLLKKHHAVTFKSPKVTLTSIPYDESVRQRMIALIYAKSRYFIYAAEEFEGYMHMWIWSMDKEHNKSKDVLYILQLEKQGSSMDSKMSHSGICLPYKLTPQEVIEHHDCLTVSLHVFKKDYVREIKGVDTWSVKITLCEKNN